MVRTYDLCLAWSWPYDTGFRRVLEGVFRALGARLLVVGPAEVGAAVEALEAGELAVGALLDRASDDDPRFLPLVRGVEARGAAAVNPFEMARRSWDKAQMHRAMFATIHTPYTIVLPSHEAQPDLPAIDLAPLGGRFAIKPAGGGGGDGVVVAAVSPEEVQAARQEFPSDEYILQAQVDPVELGGRPAWFRVLVSCGSVYPCWWPPSTHRYASVTVAEEAHHGLAPLRTIAGAVAEICGLGLFSTEIALRPDGTFVVVDYVNDPIDLRLRSECGEGVPDDVVRFVAEDLAGLALARGC